MCFQNLREKSLAYPQATREELLRHFRELLEVTTEEKTPICTVFLEELGISILLLVSFLDLPQDSFSCRSAFSYLLLELDATVCVLVLPRKGAVLGAVSMSFDFKHAIWSLFWCIVCLKLL